MRTVVGLILLLLAACLAELGLYFWMAPRAQPVETPISTAEVGPNAKTPEQKKAIEELIRSERIPRATRGPPSNEDLVLDDRQAPKANTSAELQRADASEKAAAEKAAAENARKASTAAEAQRKAAEAEQQRLSASKAEEARQEKAAAERAAAAPKAAAEKAAAEKAAAEARAAKATPQDAELEQRVGSADRKAAEEERRQEDEAKARQAERNRLIAAASRQGRAPEADPFGQAKQAGEEDAASYKRTYNPKTKDLAQIVENIEQLPKGDIVLDGPNTMKVSETRAVHANVGVNVPIETLRKDVRPGSQTDEGKLAVSSEMIAVLSGPGFKITATTPEQQSVAEGYPTVWSWDVEAKSAGDQELEATLYALTPSRQRIASYKHKISVSVMEQTWGEWVKSFRDEIDAIKGIVVTLSGVVTGLVGWLVLYSDRRKKKEAPSVPSEAS